MNLVFVVLSMLLPCQAAHPGTPALTMRYFQGEFVLREGKQVTRVPLQLPKPKPRQSLAFRKNKMFVVWDDRGLTVRVNKKLTTYALTGIPVSPRIFSREDILKTLELVKEGKRRRAADALSGAVRIGNLCYLLVRWDTSEGAPWLETLVSVDFSDAAPAPKLVAKLPAHSIAAGQIDDKLFMLDDKLSVITRSNEDWGISQYEAVKGAFLFVPLGKALDSYTPIDARLGLFVEKTSYGTYVGGRVDLTTHNRKDLGESRGKMHFLDAADPPITISADGPSAVFRNAVSGAEATLPSSVAARRTTQGIIVWSPFNSPKHAWLYEPSRWAILAEWPAAP